MVEFERERVPEPVAAPRTAEAVERGFPPAADILPDGNQYDRDMIFHRQAAAPNTAIQETGREERRMHSACLLHRARASLISPRSVRRHRVPVVQVILHLRQVQVEAEEEAAAAERAVVAEKVVAVGRVAVGDNSRKLHRQKS